MKLERFKSFVLTALIISSIVLTFQIWFNERLWPDGYNFFAGLKNSYIGQLFGNSAADNKPKETVQEDILVPYNFFVYTVKESDHAGYMLTPKDSSFSYAKSFLHEFIGGALSQANASNFSKINESDWQDALCADGIYVSYGAEYMASTFLQLVNAETDTKIITENISTMGRFAVVCENTGTSLFINDLSNNTFYKVSYNAKREELAGIIASCSDLATIDNRFSFFIGADAASPIEGAAVFAPYIVLSENNVEAKSAESATKQQTAEKMLSLSENITAHFGVNPKTSRRYTDADENIVYVQNQSSVKLSKRGYIEYLSTTGNNGMTLKENADEDTPLALVLYPLVFMAEKINAQVAGNSNISVYVSSVKEDGNKYTVTLDYSFNGLSYVATDNSLPVHAVTAEIEGGYLIGYKQYIADLAVSDTTLMLPSSYGGIDGIFANMTLEERNEKINDMFVGYICDGNKVSPKWFIRSGESYTIYH